MATSEVQICRMALGHIGASGTLEALTDSTEEARWSNVYYAQARDWLLETLRPNFAMARVTLADLGSPPAEWGYRYAYPANCLAPVEMLNTTTRTAPYPYEVVQAADGNSIVILTDSEEGILWYVKRVTLVPLFPVAFAELLAWRLAWLLAEPITGQTAKVRKAEAEYERHFALASAALANESWPGVVEHQASWIDARA